MPLKLLSLPSDTIAAELQQLSYTVACPEAECGVLVDIRALNDEEMRRLDEGVPIAAWADWWQAQALALCREVDLKLYRFVPHRGLRRASAELIPATSDNLAITIGSEHWKRTGWAALVWQARIEGRRIRCAGCLAPAVDGMGAIAAGGRVTLEP